MATDPKDLKRLARGKEDQNWRFRQFLKFQDKLSEKQLDQLVYEIADSVESTIQCTRRGQCCKELKPNLSQSDQQRLADGLGMTVAQLRTQYLDHTKEEGKSVWQIKGPPCIFHRDNKCSVYAHRPENCREYPYLHKPGFNERTWDMIERTFTCPIVFDVIEELKKRLGFRAK